MAIPPEKAIDVLARWVTQRWCRYFVFVLKFVGDDAWQPAFAQLSEQLDALSTFPSSFFVCACVVDFCTEYCQYRIQHLSLQGNEVVVLGALSGKESAAETLL